jgi:hypothetical protein
MPRRDETEPVELIPVSVIRLDFDEPTDGLDLELARRGVEVVLDDLGRRSIAKEAARMLLAEQAASEERRRQLEAQRGEAAAARPPGGVPAVPGASAFESMIAGSPPDTPTRRVSLLEDALSNPGGMTYRPLGEEEADR